MSREWKPGDVAIIRAPGVGPTVGLRGSSDCWLWVDAHGKNPLGAGNCCAVHKGNLIEARPLVVIDPEDAEQVERLCLLDSAQYEVTTPLQPEEVANLQSALREFANPTPPKPDEPTGLGAVVEDADGKRWVRMVGPGLKFGWRPEGARSDYRDTHYWAKVPAVRVLSPGVES